ASPSSWAARSPPPSSPATRSGECALDDGLGVPARGADGAGERELPGGAHAVVLAPAREMLGIPTKVAILEGIGTEAGGELERDGAHAFDDEVALRGVHAARGRVTLDRGGEDRKVEARRLDVLAERVAP